MSVFPLNCFHLPSSMVLALACAPESLQFPLFGRRDGCKGPVGALDDPVRLAHECLLCQTLPSQLCAVFEWHALNASSAGITSLLVQSASR